jgi:uncharacterized repeat protein (TIGR01451 family)
MSTGRMLKQTLRESAYRAAGPVLAAVCALVCMAGSVGDAAAQGAPSRVDNRATTTYRVGANPQDSISAVATILVDTAAAAASLGKSVDRAAATPGDTLRYTLTFSAGARALNSFEITDTLPRGARYLPGSLRLDGGALPAAGTVSGVVETDSSGAQIVRVLHGSISAGASVTVELRVVVGDDAPGTLRNRAVLRAAGTTTASPMVETVVARGAISLAKRLLDTGPFAVGDEVRYQIEWVNASGSPVRDLVVRDTLPAGLAFVTADGAPLVTGSIAEWRIGTLEPGARGSVVLTVRIAAYPASGLPIVNRAAASSNAGTVTAAAEPITVLQPVGALSITKAAGVLEVGLGETVPYTVVVSNVGTVPLRGVEIHDRLPAGVRLVQDRVLGADSLRAVGRDLSFWLAGTLAPGEQRTLRYAVAVTALPEGATLDNVAVAVANAGGVRSDTALASVRMRGTNAMAGRILVGKVWLDRDGDGRQGADEPGVGGIDIWSTDGSVVTTDSEGRFAVPDLRPGTHLLRLDTLGLPAGMRPPSRDEQLVRVRTDGWTLPNVSFRLLPAAAPQPAREENGQGGAVEVATNSVATPAGLAPLLVAPARTDAARSEEAVAALIGGTTVRFVAPADGAIIASNRLFVGVRGEPGAAVRLLVGDSVVRAGSVREDGLADFVGVEIGSGPQMLRIAMTDRAGVVRWDSLSVHRSGNPTRIETSGEPLTLPADGRSTATLRARVLDAWGVPVPAGRVTARAEGVRIVANDADQTSAGLQIDADIHGWIAVPVVASREIGTGALRLVAGADLATVPVRLVAAARPLIAAGVGQVGIGAAPDAFAALTLRGSLDSLTSLTVSFDSRRSQRDGDFFGSGFDILDEARYPTLGDHSEARMLSSAQQSLSARVERGLDWIEVGDVSAVGFGDPRLGGYARSVTGGAARVGTGPLVWRGFGAMTDQILTQQQQRGDGSSGPYRFGAAVRPGTERIAIEIRARDNAARLITRQELAYGIDYQIDYATGDVLLQRAVPSSDAQGNPVYIVATLERRTGGEQRLVGGVRAELDVTGLGRISGIDSLGVSLGLVHDAGAMTAVGAGHDLLSGGFRVRAGKSDAGAELIRSASGDSTALAGRADFTWSFGADRAQLAGEWLRVGTGFSASADPRLQGGMQELRMSAAVRIARETNLRLGHSRQDFLGYDIARRTTSLLAEQRIAGRALAAELGVLSDLTGGMGSSGVTGKLSVAATSRLDSWIETVRAVGAPPAIGATAATTNQVGGGLSYRVVPGVRVEAAHRVLQSTDTLGASVSTLHLRGERFLGGAAWGGLERVDAGAAQHAAVLGWRPRVNVGHGWSAHALVERRLGLERVSLVDPARAMPFPQAERNRWSTAMGAEYAPMDSLLRFTARGEIHGGQDQKGMRFDIAGDAPIGRAVTLITRHDWLRTERVSGLGLGLRESRRERSLIGVAFRPIHGGDVNALAKVEWRNDSGPLSGASTLMGGAAHSRLIATADAVWTPARTTELASRYAVRRSRMRDEPGGMLLPSADAHYFGARAEQGLTGPLSARVDGRLLLVQSAGSSWSVAPALAAGLGSGLVVEGGYRFGTLRDMDFGRGRNGLYATLGVQFSEERINSLASFWRQRSD